METDLGYVRYWGHFLDAGGGRGGGEARSQERDPDPGPDRKRHRDAGFSAFGKHLCCSVSQQGN